jgi:hypothetical protein
MQTALLLSKIGAGLLDGDTRAEQEVELRRREEQQRARKKPRARKARPPDASDEDDEDVGSTAREPTPQVGVLLAIALHFSSLCQSCCWAGPLSPSITYFL